ncbi:DUF4924 family protein [Prolixibacteraceae bacterium JC049]|nr:DUF4924 family protein [Prolixibacteraceae bacterium JC049]
MQIAQRKRKENIAEYILYMWQIEDLIRACKADMNQIRTQLVSRYGGDEDQKKEIEAWYENLAVMMAKENKLEKGHLQVFANLVNELFDFHLALLKSGKAPSYGVQYQSVDPIIQDVISKSGEQKPNPIEACLNGIYGVLLLRMQKKEVSASTLQGVQEMSKLLAMLSESYKAYEANELEL